MAADQRPLAIAVMGPTASGKTALAIEAAQRWGGEIVSVDSALVYRGLDIGAAKPDAAMRTAVPHHLLNLRDPWQVYSAAEFAADARTAMAQIVARGKIPILAGGTGLYFRAALEGLAQMPEADPAVRLAIAAEAEQLGWGHCMRNWHGLIRLLPRASMPPTRNASSVRWRSTASAASRSATGRRDHRAHVRRCGCSNWCSHPGNARCCMHALPCAWTRCWQKVS